MATETAIKERPILFSGEMVRAILDGRKTQTRRIVKHRSGIPTEVTSARHVPDQIMPGLFRASEMWELGVSSRGRFDMRRVVSCPYGKPGNRLWVRESFLPCKKIGQICRPADASYICYRDGAQKFRANDDYVPWNGKPPTWDDPRHRFSSSIHMPRWASRITLEITDVRVERLRDITEDDAEAEGFHREGCGGEGNVRTFARLWEKINGPDSWSANPWVWVVTFAVVTTRD